MESNVASFIDVTKLLKKKWTWLKMTIIIVIIIQNFSISLFTENDWKCFTIVHLKIYSKMI